jgi:LuxR family maltose regulon positive regulatory protein
VQALPRDRKTTERVKSLLWAFAESGHNFETDDESIRLKDASLVVEALSRREIEVLGLLAQRLRDKEIARQLNIAPGTVKSHLKSLYRKLEVSDRLEAAAKAKVVASSSL